MSKIKDFYDRQLLETAKTKLVHDNFGQKRGIPRNSGKRVEFRRYELFTPDTDKLMLAEGVTPDGQSLTQSHMEAEVKQRGAYVEVSGLLATTGYDDVPGDSAELLGGQQAGELTIEIQKRSRRTVCDCRDMYEKGDAEYCKNPKSPQYLQKPCFVCKERSHDECRAETPLSS